MSFMARRRRKWRASRVWRSARFSFRLSYAVSPSSAGRLAGRMLQKLCMRPEFVSELLATYLVPLGHIAVRSAGESQRDPPLCSEVVPAGQFPLGSRGELTK